MAAKQNPTTQPNPDALPFRHFDESVSLDDPKPFEGWEPSPRQIREWAAIIRAEAEEQKREQRLERLTSAQDLAKETSESCDDSEPDVEDIDNE